MRAWLLLVGALALHVTDEALTHFLAFYNPLVLAIRADVRWFPMPTFTFGPWLIGLMVFVAMLALLTPAVGNGAIGTRFASWFLSALMFLNGCGHLLGSVYFRRWLPGSTSAPLLLASSVLLVRAAIARRKSELTRAPHVVSHQ
jgi:hypothetical protein